MYPMNMRRPNNGQVALTSRENLIFEFGKKSADQPEAVNEADSMDNAGARMW